MPYTASHRADELTKHYAERTEKAHAALTALHVRALEIRFRRVEEVRRFADEFNQFTTASLHKGAYGLIVRVENVVVFHAYAAAHAPHKRERALTLMDGMGIVLEAVSGRLDDPVAKAATVLKYVLGVFRSLLVAESVKEIESSEAYRRMVRGYMAEYLAPTLSEADASFA